MGKVVTPRLSLQLFLLGFGLTTAFAFGVGGVVYLQLELVEAKKAWAIAFSIVLILALALGLSKVMQRRSARYYYFGMAIFFVQFSILLYLFLVPVFFVIPAGSFLGGVVILVALASIFSNVQMARHHFLKL